MKIYSVCIQVMTFRETKESTYLYGFLQIRGDYIPYTDMAFFNYVTKLLFARNANPPAIAIFLCTSMFFIITEIIN